VPENNEKEKIVSLSKKAGEIAKTIKLELLPKIVLPKAKLLEIATSIEKKIYELGGSPAFPVNTCLDNIAAHYTPNIAEESIFPEEKILKVDFGVHIDGYSVDNAVSYYFGDNDDIRNMIETAKDAVFMAINNIRPGIQLAEIGGKIEDFVKERGFNVIENLNGHKIEKYKLHGEKEVPTSSKTHAPGTIEPGEIYAIEIFVTTGNGYAKSSDDIRIYSLMPELPKRLPIRVQAARKILNFISRNMRTLPFAVRWLLGKFDSATVKIGVATLERQGVLIPYPVLQEDVNHPVAQHEETILVTKDDIIILTAI